ncbi:MAG: hypothetical protein H6R26_830, partial [Proteobacteria bacterium]|nr:hypothetical protein [Pseudomonadota bacterium]
MHEHHDSLFASAPRTIGAAGCLGCPNGMA